MSQDSARPHPAVTVANSHRSEIQFQRLLDKLPVAAYMCDAEGLISYFNSSAVQVWGRAPALNDPVDRFCGSFKLFSPAGTPIAHESCWMALALKNQQEFNGEEIVIERPDGTCVTALAHANPIYDDSGTLVGAVNILIDISERRRAAEVVARLKDELAAQLDDLRPLHDMSQRLSRTLNLQSILDETLATAMSLEGAAMGVLSLRDPTHGEPQPAATAGFRAEFLNDLDAVRLTCETCLAERRQVIIEDVESDPLFQHCRDAARTAGFRAVHCVPLVTRAGALVGAISMYFPRPYRPTDRELQIADLRARQAVEFIENARLYQKLREADRRKDEFLALLAHELRNPLAPICNSLELLRLSDELSPALERVRQIMETQVSSMVRLVDDLLEVSRITRGKIELRKEPVNLATLVSGAVETSRPLIESAGHQLAISIPTEPVMLDADLVRLTQVLSNLLNNAAKYTPHGGQIWLTARQQGPEVVLSVRDTGVGISHDMQSRVFDMFAQADATPTRTHGGLGLGLTLAKKFVEMHDGRIEVLSDGPGTGSEFIVRLPLAHNDSPLTAVPPESRSRPVPLPSRRILVVDDTRAAAYTLSKLLESLGQQVSTAHDGNAALEYVHRQHPDVVISDIAMPDMSGYELARSLRRQPGLDHVVLVALTGYGQEDDTRRAKEAGFDYHLVKPMTMEALQELLASLSPPLPAAPQ